MAKYVRCVDNSGIPFTGGNCYTFINDSITCYLLRDDIGIENWWNKGMFEEPYEVPEPVIFNSQEEFENAVMNVIVKRLNVCDYCKDGRIYFDIEDAFKDLG